MRAAAWSVPAVSVATASPVFAASTAKSVDLWSRASEPDQTRDGTHQGADYYAGPRTLTFTYTFGNNGPAVLPAGGIVTIGLPFASIWEASSMEVIADPAGKNPVFASTESEHVADDPLMYRRLWHFVLGSPIAAGTSFTLTFRVNLTATDNTATNHYRARDVSDISVGATGMTDTASGNNRDFSEYLFYNNKNAGS